MLNGEAKMIAGQHDWVTTLRVQHAQTRTPTIDAWLKSADNFELQSTWFYKLQAIDWVGPFARARLQTQVWRGEAIRATETNVERTAIGKTVTTEVIDAEKPIDVTSAFEPILISETVGAYANPIEGKAANVRAKLGLGGQHVFSRGGFAQTGYDADTATLKQQEIETTHQVGGEV